LGETLAVCCVGCDWVAAGVFGRLYGRALLTEVDGA
jgi:hypothetical protein